MRLKKSFINLINKLPSVFLLLVIFSVNVVSPIYAMVDGEGDLVESSKLAETESLNFIKAPTTPTNLRFNKVYYSNLVPQLGNEVPAGSYLKKDDFDELAISFDSVESAYYKVQMKTPNSNIKETTSLDKIEWITKSLLHPIIYDLYPGFGDEGEGEYSFKVKAGRGVLIEYWSDYSEPITLIYDNTPPTKPIWTAPEDGLMTNINNVTLEWNSTDTTSGIKGYYFRYVHTSENGTITNWETGFVSSTANSRTGSYGHGNGKYEIYVKTVDNAGNVSEESDPLTITYDGTTPAIPTGLYFKAVDNGNKEVACGDYSNTKHITEHWNEITGDESFSHYEYSSFNAPNGSKGLVEEKMDTNSFNSAWWTIPREGTYGFQVRSVDKAGNKSAWAYGDVGINNACTINIDWTPPEGEFLGIRYVKGDVEKFITNERSPLLYGTYSDNHEVKEVKIYIETTEATVTTDGTTWIAQFPELSDDLHEVKLEVIDKAGNIYTTSQKIRIDSIPPTAEYTHYIDDVEFTGDDVPIVKYLSQLSFTAEYEDTEPSSGLAYDSFVIFQAQTDHSFKFSQNGAKAYCSWRKDPNRIDLSKYNQEKVEFTNCIAKLPDGEYYMAHQVYDNAVRKDIPTITQYRDVLGLHFFIKNTPEITITSPSTEVEVGSPSFEIIATVKDGNDPLIITWTGSDSFTAVADRITFNPTTAGTFTYTAEVTDGNGDTDEESITITVKALQTPETPPATEESGEVAGTSTADTPKTSTTSRTGRNATPLMANAIETTEESEIEEIIEEEIMETTSVLGEEERTCTTKGKVSGNIFEDKNDNGILDENEKTFKNVNLKIYIMGNGEKKVIQTLTTDEKGYFETTLCAGKYNIEIEEETIPSGYEVKEESLSEIEIIESEEETVDKTYVPIIVENNKTFIQKYWYWILLPLVIIVGSSLNRKKKE